MDPYLTLAHMTHNTAVVLLHQAISFPLPDWQTSRIGLPSASSMGICLAAASEVAIIAECFLRRSFAPVSSQFALCLFLCGRFFLAHSSYKAAPLAPEFDSLVASLTETSNRWNGSNNLLDTESQNLSSKFAARLTDSCRKYQRTRDMRKPVDGQYSESAKSDQLRRSTAFRQSNNMSVTHPGYFEQLMVSAPPLGDQHKLSSESISLAFPPLPLAFREQESYTNPSTPDASHGTGVETNAQDDGISNSKLAEVAMDMYEDIDSFLDLSLPPQERISVFSYTN